MLIKRASDIRSSEITDKKLYVNRRDFIRVTGGATAFAAAGALGATSLAAATPAAHGRKLDDIKKSPDSTTEKMNSWEQITTYNNFYEFGIDKDAPSENARKFNTDNWTVVVDGECGKKASWHIEDILKGETLEERI